MYIMSVVVFFFSSRRRHTRFSRDWSSDVCSSDLNGTRLSVLSTETATEGCVMKPDPEQLREFAERYTAAWCSMRSEERRVGKECRSRRAAKHYKKKEATTAPLGENARCVSARHVM